MDAIKFKMQGQAFDEGIPLHLALASMQEVQAIFDHSYLVTHGRQRVTKKDRQRFQLKTFDIKHGCLESDLFLALDTAQMVLPAVAPIAASDIWELTKSGWDFLRWLYAHHQSNQAPTYHAESGSQILVVQGNHNTVIATPTLDVAKASVHHWRRLNHTLQEGQVENYSLGEAANEAPDITLTSGERKVFDIKRHLQTEPIEITCDIFDFNKRENIGRLTITDGQIPQGDYSFKVFGRHQDKMDYIISMTKSEITATALVEVTSDPLQGDAITKLHLTEIA